MTTTALPKELSQFQYALIAPLQCLNDWVLFLIDPELDRAEYARNAAFCALVSALLDVRRSAVPDVRKIVDGASGPHRRVMQHYRSLVLALFDGVADLLSTYSRDEQICLVELRHQSAHGHRRGVHETARKIITYTDRLQKK